MGGERHAVRASPGPADILFNPCLELDEYSLESTYKLFVSSRTSQHGRKKNILTFKPPSKTGDSHTPVSDQGECPPPPLALTAQDSVPRGRRHIVGDTTQGGGAKPSVPRLGF